MTTQSSSDAKTTVHERQTALTFKNAIKPIGERFVLNFEKELEIDPSQNFTYERNVDLEVDRNYVIVDLEATKAIGDLPLNSKLTISVNRVKDNMPKEIGVVIFTSKDEKRVPVGTRRLGSLYRQSTQQDPLISIIPNLPGQTGSLRQHIQVSVRLAIEKNALFAVSSEKTDRNSTNQTEKIKASASVIITGNFVRLGDVCVAR